MSSTVRSPRLTRRQYLLARTAALSAGILLALGIAEISLRLAGFHFRAFPVVQFGWPEPETLTEVYQSDPDLLWIPRGYPDVLAAARVARPAVVFMGDSCTEFGTYPRLTLELLASRQPSLAQGIKVGVGGWSVVQGAWQLQRDVRPLRPRVVTVYFGWNDHWVALGPPDAEIRRGRLLTWAADRVRTVQLLYKVRAAWATRNASRPPRVDLHTYQTTLERMTGDIRGAGGAAVLITAPSNHVPGAEPEYLRRRHLDRLDDLIPLHDAYVAATRRAARNAGAVLCDAWAAFNRLPPPRDQYFLKDGIHLTASGDRALADLLAGCIERADASRRRMR